MHFLSVLRRTFLSLTSPVASLDGVQGHQEEKEKERGLQEPILHD